MPSKRRKVYEAGPSSDKEGDDSATHERSHRDRHKTRDDSKHRHHRSHRSRSKHRKNRSHEKEEDSHRRHRSADKDEDKYRHRHRRRHRRDRKDRSRDDRRHRGDDSDDDEKAADGADGSSKRRHHSRNRREHRRHHKRRHHRDRDKDKDRDRSKEKDKRRHRRRHRRKDDFDGVKEISSQNDSDSVKHSTDEEKEDATLTKAPASDNVANPKLKPESIPPGSSEEEKEDTISQLHVEEVATPAASDDEDRGDTKTSTSKPQPLMTPLQLPNAVITEPPSQRPSNLQGTQGQDDASSSSKDSDDSEGEDYMEGFDYPPPSRTGIGRGSWMDRQSSVSSIKGDDDSLGLSRVLRKMSMDFEKMPHEVIEDDESSVDSSKPGTPHETQPVAKSPFHIDLSSMKRAPSVSGMFQVGDAMEDSSAPDSYR